MMSHGHNYAHTGAGTTLILATGYFSTSVQTVLA